MASGLTPYYLLQPAFTGGEISAEVANRVDLDKSCKPITALSSRTALFIADRV